MRAAGADATLTHPLTDRLGLTSFAAAATFGRGSPFPLFVPIDTGNGWRCYAGFPAEGDRYLSRRLSLACWIRGLKKYSITRRFPVLISTVTAMPEARFTVLPSACIVARSGRTRDE